MWDYRDEKISKNFSAQSNSILSLANVNNTYFIISANMDNKISIQCASLESTKNFGCCGEMNPFADVNKSCYQGSCPSSSPYLDSSKNCYVQCPSEIPFFDSKKNCLAQCPATAPFFDQNYTCLGACPFSSPYYDKSKICMKQCPDNFDADGYFCQYNALQNAFK